MRTCTSCQKPLPFGARLCTNCGYDRVTRSRHLTQSGPGNPPPVAPKPTFWTSPYVLAAWVVLAFFAAAPLVWKLKTPTIIHASVAGTLLLVTAAIQRWRAAAILPESDDDFDTSYTRKARSRELTRLMFTEETAGIPQALFLASIVAALLSAGLLQAAFR